METLKKSIQLDQPLKQMLSIQFNYVRYGMDHINYEVDDLIQSKILGRVFFIFHTPLDTFDHTASQSS